jgi:transposase
MSALPKERQKPEEGGTAEHANMLLNVCLYRTREDE